MNDERIDRWTVMDNFLYNDYPKICKSAYEKGKQAFNDGLANACNLDAKPFVAPSGTILKVYKEAWEAGWRSGEATAKIS